MTESADRPKRALVTGVLERRKVLQAIAPTAATLEQMQRDAAFRKAQTEHGSPDEAKDLENFRKRVATSKARLEKALAKLPPPLRQHGRVIDLQKAIASLEVILG
jgi:hypothetical protein